MIAALLLCFLHQLSQPLTSPQTLTTLHLLTSAYEKIHVGNKDCLLLFPFTQSFQTHLHLIATWSLSSHLPLSLTWQIPELETSPTFLGIFIISYSRPPTPTPTPWALEWPLISVTICTTSFSEAVCRRKVYTTLPFTPPYSFCFFKLKFNLHISVFMTLKALAWWILTHE